ncbi:unnamed protein product, partial [Nesidiocoris tenuis]
MFGIKIIKNEKTRIYSQVWQKVGFQRKFSVFSRYTLVLNLKKKSKGQKSREWGAARIFSGPRVLHNRQAAQNRPTRDLQLPLQAVKSLRTARR